MMFEDWESEARAAWERIAPSYVQHDMTMRAGNLRELFEEGATTTQFAEALEIAFADRTVRQRAALYRAYAIVRKQIKEANRGS